MRHLLPVFTLTLPLLSCAAEERGDNASAAEAMSLWQRYGELACQKARTCCEEQDFSTEALVDCEQKILVETGLDEMIRYVADGSIAMNASLFSRCLDEAEELVDQCVRPNPIEACVNAVRGRLADGDACQASIQCLGKGGGALCLRVVDEGADLSDDPPGVCHSEVRGKLDDACVHTCDETPCLLRLTTREEPEGTAFCFWEDGLYCDHRERRCLKLAKVGQECVSSEACGKDAYCDDDGTCQRSRAAGQACDSNGECAEDLMCSESSSTCEEWIPFDEEICAGDLD